MKHIIPHCLHPEFERVIILVCCMLFWLRSLLLVPVQVFDSQAINNHLLLSETRSKHVRQQATYSICSYIPHIILVKLGFSNAVCFWEHHKGAQLSRDRLATGQRKWLCKHNWTQFKRRLFQIKIFNVHYVYPLNGIKRVSLFTKFYRLNVTSLQYSVMNLSGSHPL